MSAESIAHEPEIFETVVRKLRGAQMPPPGAPQPDSATRRAWVAGLEGELDARGCRGAEPGQVALHRLNRTEYANAIADLLALDVDVKALLPKDDESDGFDNVANVLKVSPSFLEQYIAAARVISEMAVGLPNAKRDSRVYYARARHQSELPRRRHAARHARRHARRAFLPGRRRVRARFGRARARALRRGPRVPASADSRDRRQEGVRGRDRRARGRRGRRLAPGRGRRRDQRPVREHPRADDGGAAHDRGDVRRAHDVGVRRRAAAVHARRRRGRHHRGRGEPAEDSAARDQRPVHGVGLERHAEPPAHLQLPAADGGRRAAVRARDPDALDAPGVPPARHGRGSRAFRSSSTSRAARAATSKPACATR